MTLDFSGVNAPVLRAEINEYRKTIEQKGALSSLRYVVTGAIAMIVIGTYLRFVGQGQAPVGVFVVFAAITALVVYGFYKGSILRYEDRIRVRRLSEANGLTVKYDDRHVDGYVGMIFSQGHSRIIKQALMAADGTEVGNYSYVTGSGRNRSTHNYGYIKIKLSRKLPHMVLDSKHNNFLSISNLPTTFDRSQVISLEGDFDKYYTLYAPKQYERDALYVFTPDVMAAFIDNGSKYDAEVIDDTLYVYHTVHFTLSNEKGFAPIATIVNAIGGELKDQTRRYRDERITTSTDNVVAAQGLRLKKSVNYTFAVVAILFIAYQVLVYFSSSSIQVVSAILGSFLIWGGALFVIIRLIRRSRSS